MVAAEEEGQQAGADPERHRDPERDDRVALSRFPRAERASPLRDELVRTGDLPDAGPPDPAENQERDRNEHDGGRHPRQHPLHEGDPHPELLVEHAQAPVP